MVYTTLYPRTVRYSTNNKYTPNQNVPGPSFGSGRDVVQRSRRLDPNNRSTRQRSHAVVPLKFDILVHYNCEIIAEKPKLFKVLRGTSTLLTYRATWLRIEPTNIKGLSGNAVLNPLLLY